MANGAPPHQNLGTILSPGNHPCGFHVGVGLSSAAVDHLIGIGYSFRIQAIRSE